MLLRERNIGNGSVTIYESYPLALQPEDIDACNSRKLITLIGSLILL